MTTTANFDRERMLGHYRTMLRIRAFEEAAEQALKDGHVKGAIHLSIGQEAVASGACVHLERSDLITTTHRGHGHTIAKGADVGAMFGELFGRADGTCRGKGGSMHIADFSMGMLGANGVVGAGIVIAAGAAHGVKLRGETHVVVCFFGDGATNRGPFLEGLNWAKIYALPVLFVCENNGFAATTRTEALSAGPGPAARAASLGMPSWRWTAMTSRRRRRGGRASPHPRRRRAAIPPRAHLSPQRPYRGRCRAPIARRRRWRRGASATRSPAPPLGSPSRAAEDRLEADRRAAAAEMERRRRQALAAPFPDAAEAFQRRAGYRGRRQPHDLSGRRPAHALIEEMRRDGSVWALGEDLGRGGVFGPYRGPRESSGRRASPTRRSRKPRSSGVAVGAAMLGTRPVAEMRFSRFRAVRHR